MTTGITIMLAIGLMAVAAWQKGGLGAGRAKWRRAIAWASVVLFVPDLARAAAVDLHTSVEIGNAIIMYLSGTLAAVGIVAAGVAMMMGRQSIAKWAFAGAMVSGLAFAIVRAMWSNFGLSAPDVASGF